MKPLWYACILTALGGLSPAQAQQLGDSPVRIALPGIVFTRALNGAAANASVDGGTLTLRSDAERDFFRDPDGKLSNATAPVLLAEVDNARPFTLTARVTPEFSEVYDAGTLYLWVRDDLWFKFAMERDERGRVRIVTVRTNGTSDDNNHEVVTARSVSMKISSDTRTVGFYYSLDNADWQLIRLFRNDYPAKIWVGISTQSPKGKGTSAVFDDVALTDRNVSDFRMGK